MDTAVNTRPTDPRDVNPGLSTQDIELVARADERLAHAYEKIARADEQLALVNEQIARLEKKPVNRRQSSRGRPALRGFVGLLLTAGICIAAFASQSYGEAARLMIAPWVPQLAPASSLPSQAPKLAAQQSEPTVQVAAADAAVSQLALAAQTVPQEAVAPPASPEVTQLLETMARDLANVQQEIERLKAGQEELVRENASTAEQLKANQEQMARVIANASAQQPRPKPSATASANPPPPIATSPRKPVSTPSPTQTREQARAPMPLQSGQQ
ncbi:hypothetical protein [Bradyrhizobium sp. sBnM-33]|uniref:hypothetical protein n=1 Tax=Bradyrhizobium sp. sBnM-33 TaxID=2831780 RepID=UPI001BCEB4C4|nr:hypothetical protein [Bradyrhizobium sp. sBnM-33]WOH46828.1 hypothetical protein RX328_21570 [Bradyrhizobium sp. sBnM-33]